MTALETFIVRMITNAAAQSTQKGKAKYSAYFVGTSIYRDSQAAVDAALTEAGLVKVIIN